MYPTGEDKYLSSIVFSLEQIECTCQAGFLTHFECLKCSIKNVLLHFSDS